MRLSYYKYNLTQGVQKIKTRTAITLGVIGLAFGGGSGLSMVLLNTAHAIAPSVVYNALPSVSPAINYPSQPFQAQQTDEFGDYVHLGGTARILNTVTVTMSDWAKFSDYSRDSRYSANNTSWAQPVTLNVYSNHLGSNGAPDQQLATVTTTVNVPWRPESDPSCGDTSNGKGWKVGETCFNYSGVAFNASFDLSSLNVTLPNDVIVGVALNTETWGYQPVGQPGPYNSLNVAVPPSQAVTVGTDDSTDAVFWNTHTCSNYTDGGSGGCNIFRQDTNWTPYGTVALKITATQLMPTSKDQCMKDGWKSYGTTFKNQGDCVSFIATAGKNQPSGH